MEDPSKYDIQFFKIVRDFIIEIHYKDGKIQVIDFQKIHYKPWWKELENPDYFRKVRLDEMDNLSWPNGQDFLPKHLYYWEKYGKLYTCPCDQLDENRDP